MKTLLRMKRNKRTVIHGSIVRYRGSIVLVLILSVLCSWPGSLRAQNWEFDLIADVGVIWSDNLFLEASGLEQSELIFTIAPEFQLSADYQRIRDADIRYRPEAYFYSDNSDFDEVFHVIDANLTYEFVRDALFTYFSIVNFQSIVTPEAEFSTSNVPVTGNRVDSTVFEVRPYWDQDLGFADVLLQVALRRVEYDDIDDPNSIGVRAEANESGRVEFELSNNDRQRGVAWGLNYEFQRLEYDTVLPWEYQVASATLGYWFGSTFRLFGTFGGETPVDQFAGSSLDSEFWEAGFQYRPSARFDFEAAAGERSYGDSYRLRARYTLRRGETELTYVESPSTRGDLVSNRRPIQDSDNLDNILDRPIRTDRFIRRRAEWRTSIELPKSRMTLRLFGEMRDDRSTADGTPLPDESYYGGAFRWSWRPGPKTTVGIGADLAQRETLQSIDDLTRYVIDATYSLSFRVSMRLEVWHSKQRGDALLSRDYDENQARLLLRFDI